MGPWIFKIGLGVICSLLVLSAYSLAFDEMDKREEEQKAFKQEFAKLNLKLDEVERRYGRLSRQYRIALEEIQRLNPGYEYQYAK